MDEKEKLRRQVWLQLETIARPDSRFHLDFNRFIPDFEGSVRAIEQLCNTTEYQQAERILVTPDNSLAGLRARCILDGKSLVVPTYSLARGLLCIERQHVPGGQEAYAASLDGLDVFGRPYLISIEDRPPGPDLMVTGASVLNMQGVRVSTGPSFFDLEWLILSALGLVHQQTPIFASVHDCQLVNEHFAPLPYGVCIDHIFTPTRRVDTGKPFPRPPHTSIRTLPWQIKQDVPLLREIGG